MQRALSSLVDERVLRELGEKLHDEQRDHDIRRIRELRSADTNHAWIDVVNPVHGPVLPPDLFVTAMRLRLGADIIAEPVLCNVCGKHLLDTQCKHCQVCAIGEITFGP